MLATLNSAHSQLADAKPCTALRALNGSVQFCVLQLESEKGLAANSSLRFKVIENISVPWQSSPQIQSLLQSR